MKLKDLKGHLGVDFIELVFTEKESNSLHLEVYKNEVENNGYFQYCADSLEDEMFKKYGECEVEMIYNSFNHELGEDVLSIDLK